MARNALVSTESGSGSRAKRGGATRHRILDAATKLFLKDGYSQTSLDKVAEQAGTTKPTVYSHFQSKRGLFDAVVSQNAQKRLELLGDSLDPTNDPESDLIRFGDVFLPAVLSERTQRWDRLAAAESINHPEVGEAFYNAGPARLLKRLTQYLQQQTRAGVLCVSKADRAAEQFIGILLGVDLLRTQIGQKPPSKATLKKRCREAVKVFLCFYSGENKHE